MSTRVITKDDADYLSVKAGGGFVTNDDPAEYLIVFNKDEYGYFVYISEDEIDICGGMDKLEAEYPAIYAAVMLALKAECRMICFDRDEVATGGLPIMEW